MRYPNPASYSGYTASSYRKGLVKLPYAQPGVINAPSQTITLNNSPVVAVTVNGYTINSTAEQAFLIYSNLFHADTIYNVTIVMIQPAFTSGEYYASKVAAQEGVLNVDVRNAGPIPDTASFIIVASIVPFYVN